MTARRERPYVVLSAAMSVDGFIDDASSCRLVLSNAADLDRVDEVRAGCDAILVGAGTVRADDPRLVLRSAGRRADREARGLPADPTKVTLTATGDLDPTARFFTAGGARRLVYGDAAAVAELGARLTNAAGLVELVELPELALPAVFADLAARGVTRLVVEGGSRVQGACLAADQVDELHLAVAPLLVGDPAAPRFGRYAGDPSRGISRLTLTDCIRLDEVVVLRYLRPVRAGE